MGDATALRDEARQLGRELRRAIPRTYRAYAQLHGAVLEPGALGTGTKELIALAIAVTKECDGCIVAHAGGAARNGATVEEVAEAIGVAILMNGGPATVYGPRAFAAFREFAASAATQHDASCTSHDQRLRQVTDPMTEPEGTSRSDDQEITHPLGDPRLDRILHDLEVANDAHPDR
jgi:AhpD family alkylhydroperoxidase